MTIHPALNSFRCGFLKIYPNRFSAEITGKVGRDLVECVLMAQPKIIVAEDDTVLRDLYLRKLDRGQYNIRTAVNGRETLDAITADPPDLLLLDLNMPVIDGFGVLEQLPPEKRTFPIVILTNFEDQANRDRGMKLGVKDYFVKKDMTIKALVEMVERLLPKQA